MIHISKVAKAFDGKVFKAVSNVISSLILILSIVICAVVIISTKSPTGVAKLAGHSFLSVRSDSMEDTFFPGDLIVIKRYNSAHIYKKDDVISFLAYDKSGAMYINTHRVVEVIPGENYSYVTKGDNVDTNDIKKVYSSKILGEYTGTRISKLGTAFEFAGTSKGVLLLVVLPAALIVVWQLFNYLLSLAADKRQWLGQQTDTAQFYPPAPAVDKDAVIRDYLKQQQEEEYKKQKIIEEYLAKQKEAEEAEKAKSEEAKIKAIISEFLAQQKAAEAQNSASAGAEGDSSATETTQDDSKNT